MDICNQLFHKNRSPQLSNRIVFLRTPQNAAQHPQPAVNHYRHIAGMFFFGNGLQPLLMEDVLVISRKFEYMRYIPTVLSFKTIPIILVILRKTIIFAHSDA